MIDAVEKAQILYQLQRIIDLDNIQAPYPKSLKREEFVAWFEALKLPAKLGATQISEDIIILRKIE